MREEKADRFDIPVTCADRAAVRVRSEIERVCVSTNRCVQTCFTSFSLIVIYFTFLLSPKFLFLKALKTHFLN